jgi:NitT/TauT family transport system ATP-binding protein
MTVLFVTHSIAEATYLAERAIVLSKRPARVLLDHPIALPAERSSELRGSPELAREAHVLFRVLEGDDA